MRPTGVVLAHAAVGWALCAATMGIGMAVTSLHTALVVHAVAAPLFFVAVTYVYFSRFHYTTPLQTASAFVGFVVAMDFVVVALAINRSLQMFSSVVGTWLPFGLIFTATYLTGLAITKTHSR
jgi:hypothetical protein